MEMNPTIFLDRDGVLNVDRLDFVKSVEELIILPGALEAVARLCQAGYQVIVVSNQSCIAQQIIGWDELNAITAALRQQIQDAGGEVKQFYYCPHTAKDKCACRKPQPGMLIQAGREWHVDFRQSFMVGDTIRDIAAGKSAGCRSALVLSGATTEAMLSLFDTEPDHIAPDLAHATDWILSC